MSEEVGISYGMVIGRDAKGGAITIDIEFYQQMLRLIERTGGTTENLVPKTFYQADQPSTEYPEGSRWFDTDDPFRRTRQLTDGVWETTGDLTGYNVALGLTTGGTVGVAAGGSIGASMQPEIQTIYDGQVLSWGPYDATPTLTIDAAPLPALAAGESYELAITGASATGGTASLKKRTTGGTLTAQTGSTRTVDVSNPGEISVQKPTSADAFNGAYTFSITYDIEGFDLDPGPDDTVIRGSLTIGCYYRASFGGPLVKIGEQVLYATVAGVALGETAVLTFGGFPAIGQHADPEFKLIVERRTYSGSNLTDVTQVAYSTISGGSTSTATPSNLPRLTLRIDPK